MRWFLFRVGMWVAVRRKAIVAAVVALVVAQAAKYGTPLSDAQVDAVTAAVTALLVWAVPNSAQDDY